MKVNNKIIVLIMGLSMLVACGAKSELLSPSDFASSLSMASNPVLLDVRTPEEFSSSHLEGASSLNVHGSNFENEIIKLDKEAPIYLYCKSGARSAAAAEILVNAGFSSVYDLDGGLLSWEASNLPVLVNKKASLNKYTLEEYNQIIDSNKLVLVDFYADWCGPCKMMAPHIKAVKEKHGDKLKILKVDTDKSLAIGQHFNITGIPLVKVYFEGKEVYDKVGYHKQEELEEVLKSYL
ncbi:MAG: thioredoxin fold domain-containing protein [Bacteroidia bacterium]|nr:thioredoxin fold domain-containing protein [Bacteroidia bacterium]NNJ56497.1 thioredoxin fold domain-containing protein [Bacteroidia bacterium]